jgi:hypothetical protein
MPITSGRKQVFEPARAKGMKTILFLPVKPRRQLQSA